MLPCCIDVNNIHRCRLIRCILLFHNEGLSALGLQIEKRRNLTRSSRTLLRSDACRSFGIRLGNTSVCRVGRNGEACFGWAFIRTSAALSALAILPASPRADGVTITKNSSGVFAISTALSDGEHEVSSPRRTILAFGLVTS